MLHHQDDRSPYLSSLRPSFWLVLQTEIVVFRLLISRRLQNGLTSCGTDILDHLLGSQKVNYERGRIPIRPELGSTRCFRQMLSRGLWSVQTVEVWPYRQVWNFSQPRAVSVLRFGITGPMQFAIPQEGLQPFQHCVHVAVVLLVDLPENYIFICNSYDAFTSFKCLVHLMSGRRLELF